MEALFLLIPLSVLALAAAAWLFLRMNSDGQFDEGEGPAWQVLMDDDRTDVSAADANATDASGTGEKWADR